MNVLTKLFVFAGVFLAPSVSIGEVVFQNDEYIHLGDEEITNWSELYGRCVALELPEIQHSRIMEVQFKPYALERAFIQYNEVVHPIDLGEARSNYWGDEVKIPISIEQGAAKQNLLICAENMSADSSRLDYNDFMFKNLTISVLSRALYNPALINQEVIQDGNYIDISGIVTEQGDGFALNYADWYFNTLDEAQKKNLCNFDLYERRGINYCIGFFSEHIARNGEESVGSNLRREIEQLTEESFSKEFAYVRDSYCEITPYLSTFERGVGMYPSTEVFGNNSDGMVNMHISECSPYIEALSELIQDARMVSETNVSFILNEVRSNADSNPRFVVGKPGADEGFFWLEGKKLDSLQALQIPADIRAGSVRNFSTIGFWGYVTTYSDEGYRVVAELCTSPPGQVCTNTVPAIFAPQPNPAIPNKEEKFLEDARGFVRRAVEEQRGIYVLGFTGVFANTGEFYVDVQEWYTF